MNGHYYNDHDPQVCAWLRELIAAGYLPEGDVDDRSITDVDVGDLRGYVACHFFAGIGGWPLALRLAGWPDDRPVWTGSPPCQPFSSAGRKRARNDDRHLAPAFLGLVWACRPPLLFGEQVASASVVGKAGRKAGGAAASALEWAWLDDLQDGLEAAGYAVGAADLPAAGVGAPHIRQRVFFGAIRLADAKRGTTERQRHEMEGPSSGMQRKAREQRFRSDARYGGARHRPDAPDGFWRDADWLGCRDGKWRPVEPGSFPLADGLPARVVRLRGYGNAIVPQVAAEFVSAFVEAAA